jgi:hypothetical protein
VSIPPRFERRQHRPPPDSGGRLFDPPLIPDPTNPAIAIDHLVDNNRLLRAAFDTQVGDLKLWELIAATRRELLTVATEYTASYRDVHRPADTAAWIAAPIIMGGHQPELFHPGVWLKHFAIDAYARRLGGTAINLVIDTDRCHTASVGVPVGTPDSAVFEQLAFDQPGPPIAWEERGVLDPECFRSFGRRAADLLTPLVPDCILRRWWPLAVERATESHRLGLGMAQARHQLEERWGLETIELPASELMRLPTVMVFTAWLLARSRELHDAYNTALRHYRRRHRQRGHTRPMPDLVQRTGDDDEGPWLEVPWWLWSEDDLSWRRVFANTSTPGILVLSDMETLRVELPISLDTSPEKWVDALTRMEEHALRLRPRAIITTLISRLLVADVFVHGIGGAAYDEITDEIVRALTGCDPPRHAVVSGTLRLPLHDRFPELSQRRPAEELADVQQTLRDLEYHPERHLLPWADQPEAVRDLVTEKQRWIETHPTPTLARRRCREIRATNDRLAYHTQAIRQRLLGRVGPLAAAVRAEKVLLSRDIPWCFFPENKLREFLLLEID